jgi:predicted RNase H-like nuclease (RuvC/YqgF family)
MTDKEKARDLEILEADIINLEHAYDTQEATIATLKNIIRCQAEVMLHFVNESNPQRVDSDAQPREAESQYRRRIRDLCDKLAKSRSEVKELKAYNEKQRLEIDMLEVERAFLRDSSATYNWYHMKLRDALRCKDESTEALVKRYEKVIQELKQELRETTEKGEHSESRPKNK